MRKGTMHEWAICILTSAIMVGFTTCVGAFLKPEPITEEDRILASEAEELMETGMISNEPVTDPAVFATEPTPDIVVLETTEWEPVTFEGVTFEAEIETVQIETASEIEWFGNDETDPETELCISDADAVLLQRIAWAEAGGEGPEAMAMIMQVVLNRVNDPYFPNSVADVIMAPGQFTPVSNGTFAVAQPNAETADALEMVRDGVVDVHGATYFATINSTWHRDNLQYLYNYGPIYFYTTYK